MFLEIDFSTFDSPRDYSQRIQSDDVQRNRGAVPGAQRMKTSHTSEDSQNQGTIPMPTFATKPWTTSSTIPVELPQNYMVGQQRQQISETQVTTCSVFPSEAMLWIKEVEMVDSVDELKSSREDCLCSEQDHQNSMFKKKRSASRSRKPTKSIGFYEEDRSLS